MDLSSILVDSALRKREFPITARKVFLAHAATSPLPRSVSAAMAEYAERASWEGQWEYIYSKAELEARRYAARLLGGGEDEIAFVSSTSMGLSIIASGYPWEEGDNVIVTDGDFPSNIYPWLNLVSRGVRTKFIPRRRDGSVTPDDVMRIVDERTRLVSLSSVNFVTGYRVDVSSIGKRLSERGILFCVDAVQSLGALPFDASFVDFAASSAHKWLLGPLGIGILYIKRRNLGRIAPVLAGWKCVQESKKYLIYNLCFVDSARRFEPGGLNAIGIMGLHAALKLLLEIGIENIAGRLRRLQKDAISALDEKGYEVLSPSEPETSSGIISFTSRKLDIPRLRAELDSKGFIVSLRDNLEGGKCIRLAPHFYNTEEELSVFLTSLPDVR